MRTDLDYARVLDDEDELAPFRQEFVLQDPELIYLDGNSLGRLPKATQRLIDRQVDENWGGRLIRGWNEGWYGAADRIGAKIGQLLGAAEGQVIVADSTSVNLYKLAHAALRARPARRKIVSDDLNFPSDLYILQGLVEGLGDGRKLTVVSSPDGISLPAELIEKALDEDTALLTLSHTSYRSGFTHDMAALTEMAHQRGALVLWDLSHSAGALAIDLRTAGVDLAVGCTYKYLNGGPGAPAFLFVRADLQEMLNNPISGWFGQRAPFQMDLEYQPAQGIRRYLTGTPPVLSLLAIEPGVDLLLEAGTDRLRAKSIRQSEYLIGLWRELLQPLGFRLGSPADPSRRGSHVALAHDHGLAINLALIEEMQVVTDFRPPDCIRFGIAPLYTSFAEIHETVYRLRKVVEERRFEDYEGWAPEVT